MRLLQRVAMLATICFLYGMLANSGQAISGRVCDYRRSTEGNPFGIPGVRVSVLMGKQIIATQATGLDGSYKFDKLPERVSLIIKFELAGYLRHPTIKTLRVEQAPLKADVFLLKSTDAPYVAHVADRLKERLARKNSDYDSEMAIFEAFGLKKEEHDAVLAMLPGKDGQVRLAVLEFKNKADNQWWYHGGAEAAQDVFVTELVKSGRFQVVEREQLAALLQEKNLTLSGDVDPKTAVKIGKLLGVHYLLTGAVTEYGTTDKGAGSGIGRLPGFNTGKRSFVAAMNARLIDTSTGEIVWADEARAEESSVKVSVGGFGGGVDDDRMFDKVMKPCIQQLTVSLKAADLF